MPDPLALLDAEVSRLEAELARARDARDLLARLSGQTALPRPPVEAPAAEETPPGKPEPRPAATGSGEKPGPKPDPDRLARALAALARGPLKTEPLADLLAVSIATVNRMLGGQPKLVSRQSPRGAWVLTEAGRAAAATA